jgi:hypothetical protein
MATARNCVIMYSGVVEPILCDVGLLVRCSELQLHP